MSFSGVGGGFQGGDALLAFAAIQQGRMNEEMSESMRVADLRSQMAGDLAINLGGAAKPSGAGGGDVGVALFVDDAAARDFTTRLAHLGLEVVDLGLDTAGVHRRQPGKPS